MPQDNSNCSNRCFTHNNSTLIEEIVYSVRRSVTSENIADYKDDGDNVDLLTIVEDAIFEHPEINTINPNDVSRLVDAVFRRVRNRYGILFDLLEDRNINEVMVNGIDNIFVEKNRRIVRIDDAFTSAQELEEIMRMLASDVHREINDAHPIVDARLPNGYRVNGVLSNVAINGPILTIRKFSDEVITVDELIEYGSVTRECMDDLGQFVKRGYNIFISGGTSTGKTTFLNALSTQINPDERIIIIEDSAEVRLDSIENKVHMECRNANSLGIGEVTMEKLIKTSLRMRPDRIIVGEVRGKEVVDMIQAMNTGHQGSMSTGHGNSIKGMLNRLETMYLSDASIPLYSLKSQISSAIDIFVHLMRDASGRRMVSEVAELVGFDGRDYILNYLYELDVEGKLVSTGNSIINKERLSMQVTGEKTLS